MTLAKPVPAVQARPVFPCFATTPMTLRLFSLLLCATLLAGCGTQVVNPVTGEAERSVMTEADEIEQGARLHAQVLEAYGVVDDPQLQAYVNGVGQRLAAKSHRPALRWTFTVLDSPEINAFALPGGHVYVTRGIMAYLDDEADLAGVIGHEIGHVTARHGAQRATRQQTAGIGVFAATVLGAVLEGAGVRGATDAAGQVSQQVAAGTIASYSREQELQADRLGAEYLARSRYDPDSMVAVIQLLRDQERFAADAAKAEGRSVDEGSHWLASHPSNERRLQDIREIAAKYVGEYGDDGRARYLDAIAGLPFGETRAQGVVRGRDFFHEPLGIALTAPEGWKIRNTDEAVLVVNAAGDAGLIVRVVPPQAGRSHDEIIAQLKVDQLRTERATLHGLPATRFTGTRRNAQGQALPIRATVATAPSGRHLLLVQAGRDAAAMQRAQAPLRQVEASLRGLSAADRRAARPWVVQVAAYPRGGFAQLAKQSPLAPRPEAHLRLLNGLYEGGEPKVGERVKVIGVE
jgi:predicted Zn-dependent protease